MQAGQLNKVFVCIDPTSIITPAGTETHAVLFAPNALLLDRLITRAGWTRNNGFYYALKGRKQDVRVIIPAWAHTPIMPGLFVTDPADQRQDFLYCGTNEHDAKRWLAIFGWRWRWWNWTKS